MTRLMFALAALALAGCTPQPKVSVPESTVIAIYDTLAKSKGETPTPKSAIPMTEDLKALMAKAETASGAASPVFDFDLAGLCQDCTGFADLKVAASADPQAKMDETHATIDAHFKTMPDAAHVVIWDLVGSPQGWLVDNIRGDLDVRHVSDEIIASAAAALAAPPPEADAAVECATYILLQQAASPKDAKKLETAAAAWRIKAATYFTVDELAQYLASSQAVLDDTPPAELAKRAQGCVDTAPKLEAPKPPAPK